MKIAALLLIGLLPSSLTQWSAFPANGQNTNQAFQFHQYGLDARTVDSATRLAATKVFLANVRDRVDPVFSSCRVVCVRV
jgi:hypothetical protein